MKLSHLLYFGAAFAALFCISHSNAATITVTKTGDSGAGTLRQAISDNEAAGGGNTINFSITGAITLTSGELLILKDVTITGPGARLLTVQRSTASGTPDFGIFGIRPGTVSISGLTITNASGGSGVLVQNISSSGIVTVSDCTITGNNAPSSEGGGVFNHDGHVTLINCTVSNNTAREGAGVENQAGIMNLLNCTVVGNNATTSANTFGGGGGIANIGGFITLLSCTISGNSATTNANASGGGGIYNGSGTIHIGNTIVSGNNTNQTGDDVRGTFTSDGYNLIRNGDGGTGFTGVGDQVGTAGSLVNANLSPLQNNGGPTDTKKPVSPSNAIDQGKSFGLTTDQRGRLRTNDNPNIQNAFQGDGTDIGAVEVQPPITSTVTNNNDTFEGSLRERILDANGGDTINFAPNVKGTITLTSDQLLVDKSLTIAGPGARTLTVARSSANGYTSVPHFRDRFRLQCDYFRPDDCQWKHFLQQRRRHFSRKRRLNYHQQHHLWQLGNDRRLRRRHFEQRHADDHQLHHLRQYHQRQRRRWRDLQPWPDDNEQLHPRRQQRRFWRRSFHY